MYCQMAVRALPFNVLYIGNEFLRLIPPLLCLETYVCFYFQHAKPPAVQGTAVFPVEIREAVRERFEEGPQGKYDSQYNKVITTK